MRNVLNMQDVQRIAAEASCDPRTVRSFLEGKKTREMVKARAQH